MQSNDSSYKSDGKETYEAHLNSSSEHDTHYLKINSNVSPMHPEDIESFFVKADFMNVVADEAKMIAEAYNSATKNNTEWYKFHIKRYFFYRKCNFNFRNKEVRDEDA